MKKLIFWLLAIVVVLIAAVVFAGIMIPKFVDVDLYKSRMEEAVSKKIGCSFSVGEDMKITVFPWLGIRVSDVHVESPGGKDGKSKFDAKDMLHAKNFEARLKLIPLFFGNLEIGSVILDSPRIFLERSSSGKANWESTKSEQQTSRSATTENRGTKNRDAQGHTGKQAKEDGFFIKSFGMDRLSITNGLIQFVDKQTGTARKITDLDLSVSEIDLEKSVELSFQARVDGNPFSLTGKAGPLKCLFEDDAENQMDLDFTIKALDMVSGHLIARATDFMGDASIKGQVDIQAFSLKKLFAALKIELPMQTADSKALEKIAFSAQFRSTLDSFFFSDALVTVDDTNIQMDGSIKDFHHPVIAANIHLNGMDADRYLPSLEPSESREQIETIDNNSSSDPLDFSFLSKYTIDIQMDTGRLKIKNLIIDKSKMAASVKNGLCKINPLELELYDGKAKLTASSDLSQSPVQTKLKLDAVEIQAKDLLADAVGLKMLEGNLESHIRFDARGMDADTLVTESKGDGSIVFTDGAIVGIDLDALVQNTVSILNGKEILSPKARSDFSELFFPFSLAGGIATIENAILKSPFMRANANGTANLVDQNLDIRLEPKLVGTIKGQGDQKNRSGVLVPLKITGSFSNPKIRPDATQALQKAISDPEQFKKDVKSMEQQGRAILKSIR